MPRRRTRAHMPLTHLRTLRCLFLLWIVSASACAEEDLAAPLRKLIVAQVTAGKNPHVVVPLFGKDTKVQLVRAEDKSLTIAFMGNDMPLAWKDLAANHLGAIAAECATTGADYVELVKFYAANGMQEKAEKASATALEL